MYPHNILVTSEFVLIKVVRDNEVKKVKLRISGVGGMVHVHCSRFREERKSCPSTLFKRHKSKKKRKMGKVPKSRKLVKSGLFRYSQLQKLAIF